MTPRLNPFAAEDRTMKSNLLYRGQESEYGYAWMEFLRSPDETVTLIIGMRAHRNSDNLRIPIIQEREGLLLNVGSPRLFLRKGA